MLDLKSYFYEIFPCKLFEYYHIINISDNHIIIINKILIKVFNIYFITLKINQETKILVKYL